MGRFCRLLAAAVTISLGTVGLALAAPSYDDPATPEGWAWAQIKQGRAADFNERCNTTASALDPRAKEEARWTDHCRLLPASFLVDILARSPWRAQVPSAGVVIVGARIEGGIDLQNTRLERSLVLRQCRIEGGINLDAARTDSVVEIVGSQISGAFAAPRFRSEPGLTLRDSEFKWSVSLVGARIDGLLDMDGASVDGHLNADGLQVGDALFMRSNDNNRANFNEVVLVGARVARNVEMSGATLDGNLLADGLQVGAYLFLRSTKQHKASFKGVLLRNVRVAGSVEMDDATFDKDLIVEGLQVGGSLYMRNVVGNGLVNMIFVQTGGGLDLRGATFAQLDLSGASVAGDLRLGGTKWRDAKDRPAGLTLRNARVANLMDTKDAWPTNGHMHIDGFTFTRLGGFEGDTGPNMRARGMKWWDAWARGDPDYTPTPYEQLAAAFVAAGDRPAADEIRYLGRVRQRETESGMRWVLSGFLQYVAGFGIGNYTFRVLYWVAGISLAGALYLWACVPRAREHGPIWCFGASLSRLLPVIEINREFSDFFNDPKRQRLTGLQSSVFSIVGMMGWLLGAILVAAVSGLTQTP